MTDVLNVSENPVLHVVVVGFHHKKGSQVEYSYPPLIPGGEVDGHEAPAEWKNLASLAIPDGAHNYVKDTIYFHLPSLEGSHRTVYGVACYRQIDSKDLKNRTVDITRSTVQKSVCVLSYLPLYGLIQAKLELITHAYFKELDFSKVSLLEDTYRNLNHSLTESLLDGGSQVFLGMSCKDVILLFKHKIVLLFKLILLERRVLFTGTPVQTLSNTILSILSLYPGMIEHGLIEAASYGIHKHISANMKVTSVDTEVEDFMEIRYSQDIHSSPELSIDCDTYLYNNNIEAPESPTMERGDQTPRPPTAGNVQSSCDTGLSRTHSLGRYADSSRKKFKDNANKKLRQSISLPFDEEHYSDDKEMSSDDNGVLKTSCDHVATVDPEKSHDLVEVSHDQHVLLSESGPMMMAATQLESVQTGKCIPNTDSVINIEALSQSVDDDLDPDMNYFGSPSLLAPVTGDSSISLGDDDGIDGQIGLTDSVEELDSPESISQIDREDCFSWEEDRLLLAIDTEKSSQAVDDTVGLASSFKETSVLERSSSFKSETKDDEIQDVSREPAARQDSDVAGAGSQVTVEDVAQAPKDVRRGSATSSPSVKAAAIKNRLSSALSGLSLKQKLRKSSSQSSTEQPPSPAIEATELPNLPVIHHDELGFPLSIFTKGSVCHPYLSLQYFDLLHDVNVRSFVIGATNILFRQKRHLTDIVVDINEARIDLRDRELQRQLTLTTADLRFADILVKGVMGQMDDIYLDGTEWEGGDEWLRAQFRLYIESMLATVVLDDPKLLEDFGPVFIQTWKTTHNYRVWASCARPGIDAVQAGHPCQGNLGVSDIRVRLAHTMQSTERGKKINAAVSQTGKYVVQTGKAVGGALTQAKSSLSSWFSTLTSEWKGSDRSHTATQPAVHKPTHSKNTHK